MKKCTKCGVDKELRDFNAHINTRDKLQSWCRSCTNLSSRDWGRRKKDRLYENGGFVCEICSTLTDRHRVYVDHDHKTGLVRGLLCSLCNAMLGFARENTATLRMAIAYLEKQNPNISRYELVRWARENDLAWKRFRSR